HLGNAPPHLLDALPEPDLLEVIIMVAQIAEIIRPDATRPDRAVGVDLRAGPPGIAIDHLIFFFQDALDQFVILDPKGFGDAGYAFITFALNLSDKPIYGRVILFRAGCDRQA